MYLYANCLVSVFSLEISMKERKTSQSSNSDTQTTSNIMMEPLEISLRERLGEVEVKYYVLDYCCNQL